MEMLLLSLEVAVVQLMVAALVVMVVVLQEIKEETAEVAVELNLLVALVQQVDPLDRHYKVELVMEEMVDLVVEATTVVVAEAKEALIEVAEEDPVILVVWNLAQLQQLAVVHQQEVMER